MLSGYPMWYTLTAGAGVCISAAVWAWMIRRGVGGKRTDPRLALLYGSALVGAILGAKLSFLAAEGWTGHLTLAGLVTGKSITGALLCGYGAVEWAKRYLGYKSTTGDLFALIVPIGIGIGRVGCILQGCCNGVVCDSRAILAVSHVENGQVVARWPAAQVELAFQAAFLVWAFVATIRGWCRTNRFHVYLITYGAFRFGHEFMRDDARVAGSWTVYHAFAAAIFALGCWGYWRRSHAAVLA
jgi:phosphatidylglycerol:prolipoprotein diacylglycerol transferase